MVARGGRGLDRQRDHDVRPRRPALLAPYVAVEGRAWSGSPATRRSPTAGTGSGSTGVNIGWTETDGEDAIQRRFHGAGDDWAEARRALPMGKLGQVDEIADLVVFLLSERSGVVTGSVIDWDQMVPGAYNESTARPTERDRHAHRTHRRRPHRRLPRAQPGLLPAVEELVLTDAVPGARATVGERSAPPSWRSRRTCSPPVSTAWSSPPRRPPTPT